MEMTKITTILRDCTSSCDFGSAPADEDERAAWWLEMIRSKSSDSGFDRLVTSYLDNGWAEGSCIGWRDGERLTEGHHRLVMAILLGLDEVPTAEWGEDYIGSHKVRAHHEWKQAYVDYLCNEPA